MPILAAEPASFPEGLFDNIDLPETRCRTWWVLHVKPRQEKSLARQLYRKEIPFFLPLMPHRSVVRGRILQSLVPLFTGYVFLLGDSEERLATLATSRVVRTLAVVDQEKLWKDLRQ